MTVKEYWKEISENGKLEGEIKREMDTILGSIKIPTYLKEEEIEDFIIKCKEKVIKNFESTLSGYNIDLSDEQVLKNKFFEKLNNMLDLKIRKKALGKITFNSYEIYQFIRCLSSIVDEIPIKITREEIQITALDPNRISLIIIVLSNDSLEFFKEGLIYINVEDFAKLLKSESSDQSITEIIFGEDSVFITITSKKYGTIIERKLEKLNLKPIEVPHDTISRLQHIACFTLSKTKLQYLFKNLLLDDLVKIIVSRKRVIWQEFNEYSKNDIILTRKNIFIKIDEDQLGEEGNKESYCQNTFSKQYLLLLNKMLPPLENGDEIIFYVKKNIPLKAIMKFKKLGNCQLTFFIAPKGEEEDIDFEEEEYEEEEGDGNEQEQL
ncbi:MAG: hypothetical protein ACTSYC_07150 [Promethearchaeota archaeon]